MLTAPTVTRPIRLPDLPAPQRDAVVGNVPGEVSAFVGRKRELRRLHELQAEARMLSLVGPGGVGKTRLAVRLGAEVRGAFADGVWLVDLSPIADPALVPQAVGDVLGVQRQPGHSWLSELTRVLRARRLLLVLDNCEHLIAACAELVEGLLPSCPDLRLVATTQQPLGAAGETILRVSPLPVPPVTISNVVEIESNEAVQLFVARVRAHQPDFALSAHNAQVIADICRRLDGLPLALELVAARVASLGVQEAAARLSDRFALAIGRSRTAPARRQTLYAALEWSVSLLSDDELTLLRRLSVFAGGWTLEAAEAVCGSDQPSPEPSVVDTLDQLVAKSLVVADHAELTVRYRLLETVRAYASSQLVSVGDAAIPRRRHAEFMARIGERAPPLRRDSAHLALLKPEEDNFRAALEWATQQDAGGLGLRLTSGAFRLWQHTGHYLEGSTWCDRVLRLPSAALVAIAARATTLSIHAQLLVFLGEYQLAEERAQSAFEEHLRLGDARGIAFALSVLGNVALQRGDLERARAKHVAATQQLRESGSPLEAGSLLQAGHIACELGDIGDARRCILDIEAILHSRRDPVIEGALVNLKGLAAASEGDAAAAAALFEEALVLRRLTWDHQGVVRTLTSLGHARVDLGQTSAAFDAFEEALHHARASGERVRVIRTLEGCARCIPDADAAARLAGATDRARAALGAALWPSERRHQERCLARARRTLGQNAYQRAWQDGQASTLDQAISMAEACRAESRSASSTASVLSPRELEVAVLLARGLTNKQVAAALVVSPATARSHVEHILAKLDLHSRAQIGVWASQQGLLTS